MKTRIKIVFAILILSLVQCFFLSELWAGSFLSGIGSSAMGRGSAFVVKADDLSCLWYNPAGLTKIKGLYFGVSLFQDYIEQSFKRKSVPEIEEAMNDTSDKDFGKNYFDEGKNNPVFLPLPYFVASYYIESINLTIAISPYFAVPLPDLFRSFGRQGASRYVNFNQAIDMYIPQIAFGWAPLKWLKIGGSIEMILAKGYMDMLVNAAFVPATPSSEGEVLVDPEVTAKYENGQMTYNKDNFKKYIQDRERPISDITIRANAKDLSIYVWGSIGLIIEPVNNLEFGFSFRPATEIRLDAELDAVSLRNKTEFFDPERGYNTNSPLHNDPLIGPFLKENGKPIPLITSFYSNKAKPIGIVLKIPPIVNAGVRYNIKNYGDIELDFTWQGNHAVGPDEFVADFSIGINDKLKKLGSLIGQEINDIKINNISDNATNRNTWIIAIGTDWNILPGMLTLRTGGQFEYGMQGEADVSSFYDVWHLGMGFGISYIYDSWLKFDLAYAFMYYPTIDVIDTSISSINLPSQFIIDKINNQLNDPATTDDKKTMLKQELKFYQDEILNHIQNGIYQRFDHMMSLGISVLFNI